MSWVPGGEPESTSVSHGLQLMDVGAPHGAGVACLGIAAAEGGAETGAAGRTAASSHRFTRTCAVCNSTMPALLLYLGPLNLMQNVLQPILRQH